MREAGAIALKMFRGELRSWTKDHNSPVSEADIAVDVFLRERLSRPGIGWLSEESEDDLARLDSERLFIVDPIDGTRSYLAGREDWSIAAALVEKGRPVAAAVYVPVSDEMYVASAGAGATQERCSDPRHERRLDGGRADRRPEGLSGPHRRKSSRAPSRCPKSTRWLCAWPGSPTASSTPHSPP